MENDSSNNPIEIVVEDGFIDPETGMFVEIVRDAKTGDIIGKNERFLEQEIVE